jgi:hypothetical protein
MPSGGKQSSLIECCFDIDATLPWRRLVDGFDRCGTWGARSSMIGEKQRSGGNEDVSKMFAEVRRESAARKLKTDKKRATCNEVGVGKESYEWPMRRSSTVQ